MFNNTFSTISSSQILLNRLQRVQNTLRSLIAYTMTDYQAAVYSRVNAILNLGNKVLPISNITPQSPATIGDIESNLNNVNVDGQDIAAEITSVENSIAQLFNLTAGVQNTLRQSIREKVFSSTNTKFIEDFINDKQLQSDYSVSLDFNAGVATNSLTLDTIINPTSIIVGPSSIPTNNVGYDPIQLLNPSNRITNVVSWVGNQLELQLKFDNAIPINRLVIQQDNYQGLEITSLSSSPDGSFFDDIDIELSPNDLELSGQSGKFSGDVILDFNPRNMSVMKIVFTDLIGLGVINLRGISTHQRTYTTSGSLQTNAISTPSGVVKFTTNQLIYPQLTTIVHQLSYDGVHYQIIQPGDLISLSSSPFWYKADLSTLTANFTGRSSPLSLSNGDPRLSGNYIISNITTTSISTSTLQRTLSFSNVSGPIVLNETPTPGTLAIYYGSVLQSISVYTFSNNTIVLGTVPQSNVTLSYQTSSLGISGLANLKNYFSPFLYSVSFEGN